MDRRDFIKRASCCAILATSGISNLLAEVAHPVKTDTEQQKTQNMKKVKITIIKTEYYHDIAEKYAIDDLPACPIHKVGQTFISDGINKPKDLCMYAWLPIKEMVGQISRGELMLPRGTWMRDDDKGIFACVDGIRPVIMLVEAIDK